MKTLVPMMLVYLFACGSQTDRRAEVVQSITNTVIVDTYDNFTIEAQNLQQAVKTLCETDNLSRDDAQGAWDKARQQWKHSEVFAFGPEKELPAALGAQIDFWPVRTARAISILDDVDPITSERITNAGSSDKGLPIIEYLLFDTNLDASYPLAVGSRRCDYLRAATVVLLDSATTIRDAWRPANGNYAGNLLAPASGKAFEDYQSVLSELVSRMSHTVENARMEKLGKPAGTHNGGNINIEEAESQFAGRSIEDIRDNLMTLEWMYYGRDDGQLGLRDLLADRGHNLDAMFQEKLDAARSSLNAIEVPFENALTNDREDILAAIDALADLQQLIGVDVIGKLDLTLRFNDADGD